METANKRIAVLVLVLLFVSLGLGGYIYLLKQQGKIRAGQSFDQWNFYELSSLLASDSDEQIALIAGVKDIKASFANFELAKQNKDNLFILANPSKENYAGEFSEPIVNSGPFRILFNFDNRNTDSEIILSGKDNWQDNEWWQNIHELRIGYNNEEGGYYLSLLNGQEEHSCWYQFLEKTLPRQSLILEFANSQGQAFWLKDTAGNVLVEVSLIKEDDLKMEGGLFPYSSMKVGVNLPPKGGKLILHKLLYYQLQ